MAFDPFPAFQHNMTQSVSLPNHNITKLSLQSTSTMDETKDSSINEPQTTGSSEIADNFDHDIERHPTAKDGPSQPATKVVTAQDWLGSDDPENPYNWGTWKRAYHVTIPGLIGFVMYGTVGFLLSLHLRDIRTFASSVYSPATAEVAREFNVSFTAALLPLSLWVVGLALGPMLAAPISETFGRNVVYRFSVPISLLFTLGAGFSKNFATLLILRLLGGSAGSPILAVGGGTNADLYPPENRAAATSLFLVAPFMGPTLGPMIGGFVVQYKDWRWTQWVILFIGAAVYLASFGMQETYKRIILEKRAKKHGLAPPPNNLPKTFVPFIKFILTVTLVRPIHMLFFEPIVLFLSLYTAFTFSILFAFFAAFPYVFQRPPYNFTISQSGLVFLAIGLGVLLASASSILLDRIIYRKKHAVAMVEGRAAAAPEHRLYAAMVGSFGIPVGLFWFAWCADRGVHWGVLLVAMVPFAWGNLSIFISTALYLVDVYGALNGASALAANGMARYLMGAAFPLFTVQMYNTLGIGWATSLLGFVSVAMLPIPWVLFKWGHKIRASSHYETTKF